ncbi:hypothetical protein F2Q69_00040820 [Brassica cretica]|uniref:Pentacotripeptide-repeat region of PRORP domain-containing protein n=1 Tax=Brassica cretica TaxID=69181 RepID=A0A8S9NHI2_BRACR|nr:hypothetical protein F2Q69_00040820 [Brassica cretica]
MPDLKGVKPDVRTYTIMFSGFGVKRLKQEAVALFRKMKEDGPLPDDRTYNALIRAHMWDGDKAASAELIKEMTSFGFLQRLRRPLAWSLICYMMGDWTKVSSTCFLNH